ncbi:MAG: zinc ABC transporter substrate-binding protein [Deltaproteobacteria bacterium]|nr:MAG: zinc ABC transporter substrate-binding protein [Deltaproteobacteria bacterium]
MKYFKAFFIMLFGLLTIGHVSSAQEKKVQVVCTLPTLKALTVEVGGERVEVIALAKGDQDPHFVTPTPVLMQRTRSASLFIENGFSLELWGDQVVNGSGNPKIFRGTPGRIVAGNGIAALEVPSVLTRELGDIHPQGNPHVWLDPLLAKVEAGNIVEALKSADPAGVSYYESRKNDFFRRIDNSMFGQELLKLVGIEKLTRLAWSGQLHSFLENTKIGGQPLAAKAGGWLKAAEPLRGVKAFEFHKVWVYFARTFGIQLVGTIEERPGIPPGPQHVIQVTEKIEAEKIPLILVDNFYDPSLPNRIAQQTGAKVVLLPNQVEGEPGVKSYVDLIDHVISKTTAALKK